MLSPTDLRLIAGLEAWIALVEKNFRHVIDVDGISRFHAQHVARFVAEGKTPISLEQFRNDAEAYILRYIELFQEGNRQVRTQQDVPWPQRKRDIHEKKGIYQLYKEIIVAAGEMGASDAWCEPVVPPAPTLPVPLYEDLIGRQLLSIRGYRQRLVEEHTEDQSAWWLEFEDNAWLHISFAIAPADVSPEFLLRFDVVDSQGFPQSDSPLPFVTNPPELAKLIGLCLLAELPYLQKGIRQTGCRLCFGQCGSDTVTSVLHVSYFEPGTGLDARVYAPLLSEKLQARNREGQKEYVRTVQFARDNVSNPKDKANLERILRFLQKCPGESAGEECEFFIKYTRLYVERGILPDEIERHFRRRRNLKEAEENPDKANRRIVPLSAKRQPK